MSNASISLTDRCQRLLLELQLIKADENISVRPLTGGVASDIAVVSAGNTQYCVKFALPKLKVKSDWFAPVHRNNAEYAWLNAAATAVPDGAIVLFGQSQKQHGFAMEFISGNGVYLWKDALLAGAPTGGEATKVGDTLGRIHAVSSQPKFNRSDFENAKDFHALRIEPYILHTANQHTDIRDKMAQIANTLSNANQVLVHGDVSPKNILFRAEVPVILDAECASMGDASFDPSFCINHLILKAIHVCGCTQLYLEQAIELWNAYSKHVAWEPAADIESRLCNLIPCLMLARIDGKSPVEYLNDNEKVLVRDIARCFIKKPVNSLQELISGISTFVRD